MKKIASKIVLATALLVASSCTTNIDAVKSITLTCKTKGFTDGTNSTTAHWEEGEQFYMFRSEDWSGALMTLLSGAGSNSAEFNGKSAGTEGHYYAVRPASATGVIMPNGEVLIEVEPNNIFFAGENTATMIPQIGVGNSSLTFTSLFGVLKYEVEGITSLSLIKAHIPNKERGLYGQFEYNFKADKSFSDNENYDITRKEGTPIDISADNSVYVALPAGEYSEVELIVRNDQTGRQMLYLAENVTIQRGKMVNLQGVTPVALPFVVGSWHIKSLGGMPAMVDLYIEFLYNNRFTILQRANGMDYTKYSGTYTIDESTSTISGRYDDGDSWADSYKFSLDGLDLVLESCTSDSDVTVYEMADMPNIAYSQTLSRACAGDVKPL